MVSDGTRLKGMDRSRVGGGESTAAHEVTTEMAGIRRSGPSERMEPKFD
jgi:hypothetical protein